MRPAHWVKPNETTRLPNRHIFIDTESFNAPTHNGHEQLFRLACASFVSNKPDRSSTTTRARFTDPRALWEAVERFTKPRARTILWAHNLAYDLRIARGFELLPELGWKITKVNVHKRAAWLRWRKEERPLVMVDSVGVFNCALDEIGRDLGLRKLPLPRWGDSDEVWFARCERDVEILERAVLEYLEWLRADDLGCWQVTGAGQAWSVWRHRFYDRNVLVHDDEQALDAERRGAWTGRAEVWRWGKRERAEAYELDLTAAYCRIAQRAQLPARYKGRLGPISREQLGKIATDRAVLAEVEVTTDVPVVPAYVDGGILWPVGTFRTILWDVELELIAETLGNFTVHQAWSYDRDPVLADWASWVLDGLYGSQNDRSALQRRVLKHWSRALIGRLSMRYRSWVPYGTAPTIDFRRERLISADPDDPTDLLHVGKQLFALDGLREGDSSVPQITSWITAACRARLWRIMRHVPDGELLAVDTDSVIVTAAGMRALKALSAHPDLDGLRLKRKHRGYELRGTRNLTLGRTDRIAGVPKTAQRSGENTWTGEIWQGLDTALRNGVVDRVLLFDRRWQLGTRDRRRELCDGGGTRSRRLRIGDTDDAHNELVDL